MRIDNQLAVLFSMLFRRKMVIRSESSGSGFQSLKMILTWSCVLQGEVLVLELVAIDGLATSTVSGSEVTTLAHEVGDDTVECGSLEAESLLSCAQSTEVLRGLGDHIRPQLHDNLANGCTISSDIEENTGGHVEWFGVISEICRSR